MTCGEYIDNYLAETAQIIDKIDRTQILRSVEILSELKKNGGRLFILGVGGSAANASHAVNDFRKIAGIEAYAPTDNVSELTARTNDEGWDTVFNEWLMCSKLCANDALLILSVGGGSDKISQNLSKAIDSANLVNAAVVSIVSRDGGYAGKHSDACVLIPIVSDERITPHAEGWQGIVWHLIVNALSETGESFYE